MLLYFSNASLHQCEPLTGAGRVPLGGYPGRVGRGDVSGQHDPTLVECCRNAVSQRVRASFPGDIREFSHGTCGIGGPEERNN